MYYLAFVAYLMVQLCVDNDDNDNNVHGWRSPMGKWRPYKKTACPLPQFDVWKNYCRRWIDIKNKGTGPEARWALSRLVARMESCAEALEALMEVFHRRLVPRGFLPVQRMPATAHDQQRFYQWISQYNTLCVDTVVRNMEAPLQTDEAEDDQAPDAGPPVSVEQPSSSSGPASTSLMRARSRSRTRGSSVSSSSSSLATAEVTAEPAVSVVDPEAEQMLQATLRGDPPVLPSWARLGLAPTERPGLWHEDSPVGVESPVNGLAADVSPTNLVATACKGEHVDPHHLLDYEHLAENDDAGKYYVLDHNLVDVFYDFDNIDELFRNAVELAFWLPHPSAAIPFNAAGMERTIWQSVQREAQFGFALTPSFLLMPELPRSTEEVWQQFPPGASRSVIAGVLCHLNQNAVLNPCSFYNVMKPVLFATFRIVALDLLRCFVIAPGKYVRHLLAVLIRSRDTDGLLGMMLHLLLLARLRMVMLEVVALVLSLKILVVVWWRMI
ncbi:unnamed protein product [Symbiodinium sp. KB8]|nr:unnamed protein product [Symbiodinium sp. KB8]